LAIGDVAETLSDRRPPNRKRVIAKTHWLGNVTAVAYSAASNVASMGGLEAGKR
jgi:hypothetical protein